MNIDTLRNNIKQLKINSKESASKDRLWTLKDHELLCSIIDSLCRLENLEHIAGKYIQLKTVEKILGISKETFLEWYNSGLFSHPNIIVPGEENTILINTWTLEEFIEEFKDKKFIKENLDIFEEFKGFEYSL